MGAVSPSMEKTRGGDQGVARANAAGGELRRQRRRVRCDGRPSPAPQQLAHAPIQACANSWTKIRSSAPATVMMPPLAMTCPWKRTMTEEPGKVRWRNRRASPPQAKGGAALSMNNA